MALREDIRKLKEIMMPRPLPTIKFIFNEKDAANASGLIHVLFTL